jgi:ketosteroid isomerase-like protein
LSNVETVQAIYAAFGRGDVPFILSQLAEDVEWEPASTSEVPWLVGRKGREAVGGFFEALGGFEITKFVPTAFLESGDIVIALIDIEGTVRRTGETVAENDETHIWRFDAEGKVRRFSHKLDSYAHWKAYHG